MALPSAFQERLQQMEETRNQRLVLLQVEKDLQSRKSQLLSAKLSNLRRAEQRCLLLEKRRAEVGCRILARRAEIEAKEARYQSAAADLRALRSEAGELEEREKGLDELYAVRISEMEEFKEQARGRLLDLRLGVRNLRATATELRSALKELQESDGCLNNPEIAAAEMKKAELMAVKERSEESLASNIELRSLLQDSFRGRCPRDWEVKKWMQIT
uniref:Kinetochore protein nuf2 n=1 Tax=Anthurium amnicola TaxID=1678845 RepID=A0A1D1ZFB5_9ARAE